MFTPFRGVSAPGLHGMEKYEVLKQLGKGGMGTAYLVRRMAEPGSAFAIKQVFGQAERARAGPMPRRPDTRGGAQVACADDNAANRALREAKTLQSIEHSNIVAYVDVFLNMDQGLLQVCTVMEFCEHGNLAQLLHKTKQQGERSAPMILRGGRPAAGARAVCRGHTHACDVFQAASSNTSAR